MSQQSPVSSPTGKLTRPEARKIYKKEVDDLIKAVKAIPVIASKVYSLSKNAKCTVNVNGQTFTLGRAEFREMISHISKGMKKLPSRAFELTKSRRRVGPRAGFKAPSRMSTDLTDFFRTAQIGPIVQGQFQNVEGDQTKAQPIKSTLVPVANSKLNTTLWFTMQQIGGVQNPLYGVVSSGTLTPLFVLHAYYSQPRMSIPGQAALLSASAAMRTSLKDLMERTIDRDADKFISILGQSSAAAINQKRAQLKTAITNANLMIDSKVGVDPRPGTHYGKNFNMFNPNSFPYAHFTKLIAVAKTGQDVGDIGAQVVQVYNNMMGGQLNAQNAIGQVSLAQHNQVKLALEYKNKLLTDEKKRLKAQERARERAQ